MTNMIGSEAASGVWSINDLRNAKQGLTHFGAFTWGGDRAFVWGGWDNSSVQSGIDVFSILVGGSSQEWGNLTLARQGRSGASNGYRGVMMGGYIAASPNYGNTIDYVTCSHNANAVDFGDLAEAAWGVHCVTDSVRAVRFTGRNAADSNSNRLADYVTVMTTSNATSLGDIAQSGRCTRNGASISNAIRGVFAGGYPGAYGDHIDYITIQSTGNAQTFGSLDNANYVATGAEDDVTGLVMGGNNDSGNSDMIQTLTVMVPGSEADSGQDLADAHGHGSSHSDGVHAVATASSGDLDQMQRVTVKSLATAVDIGNLATSHGYARGGFSGHG